MALQCIKKYLNIDTYYKTNKATKAKIFYDKVSSGQSGYSKTVTLPKGTIVASDLGKNSKFYFYENRLNYGLVNKYAKKGYVVGAHSYGVSVSPSSFKKISTPSYLPTWSYGNLYLGGASAAKKFYEYPCESEC
ncbi:hypothetical protein [Secundilactobacillus oryzae]|uniref:hypothetical protein n=1 Tax=Secundilactobacillus oryzae TaxID=1202668 RepID=UPI00209382F7|nr:hypothetical protein [Secundilactobacillus oryzae]